MKLNQLSRLLSSLKEAIHKAVMAPAPKRMLPRYRPLGRAVTPYHYMQPIPVAVSVKKSFR